MRKVLVPIHVAIVRKAVVRISRSTIVVIARQDGLYVSVARRVAFLFVVLKRSPSLHFALFAKTAVVVVSQISLVVVSITTVSAASALPRQTTNQPNVRVDVQQVQLEEVMRS